MYNKNRFLKVSLFVTIALFTFCSKEITGPDNTLVPSGGTNNSNIEFITPYPNSSTPSDSALRITWRPMGIDSQAYISIGLYRKDTLLTTLSTYTANDGSFTATPPFFGTSRYYRIKITDYSDTSKYEFSNYFRISSLYSGTISVSSPIATDSFMIGSSTLSIRWITKGTLGNYLGLQLCNDSGVVSNITSSTSNDGLYSWYLSGTIPSGKRYRIKVYSTADPTIAGYSAYFTITSQYYGSYDISQPDTSSVWAAGNSYSITWTKTGSPGSYVNIELYKGSAYSTSITSSQSDYGSYSWYVPAYMETGRYRVKITSYYDASISSFSDSFTIEGITNDSYEPDNSRDIAKSIPMGVTQQHSLTLNDTDWVKFNAIKGTTYLLRSGGSTQTRTYIYRASETSYNTYYNGGPTGTNYLSWSCDSTATYYLKVNPRYSNSYGSYTLFVSPVDSLHPIIFSSPISSTVWSAGSSYSIDWTWDSSLVGTTVRLNLCIDTVPIYSISSYVSNVGHYSFSLPSGLATGSKYSIKITDYNNSQFSGYSPFFTISGTATDSFEVDNMRYDAKAISVDGIVQTHSISYADTDWVKFTVKKDTLYVINVAGLSYLYTYLYNSQGTSLSYDYSSPQISWTATSNDTFFLKMYQYSTSYAGQYRLTVRSIPVGGTISFIDPSSLAVWSSGSSYNIQWVPDTSLFGNYVRLALYRGTNQIQSISTYLSNNGFLAWTVPSGLATASNYRIRIENYNNSAIYNYSSNFSISGIATDLNEPDDSASQAHIITADGVYENRTLSYNDKDWSYFQAQRNTVYRIKTAGSIYPRLELYNSTNLVSPYMSANTSMNDSNATLSWYAATAGTYYFQVYANRTGSYKAALSSFDSTLFRFQITAPKSTDTLTRGASYTVRWTDTAGMGGSVDIFLYNSTGIVETVAAGIINNGSYSWNVPLTLAVRNDYYLKIISKINSNINGNSSVFNIK
ncbi:MAG: GPI anchored serine-threonine rich family protein [Fibrobacteres bacterium]|nr:GPI anchored serine-threonine rich family protein [Fibrobacterota bacterium]